MPRVGIICCKILFARPSPISSSFQVNLSRHIRAGQNSKQVIKMNIRITRITYKFMYNCTCLCKNPANDRRRALFLPMRRACVQTAYAALTARSYRFWRALVQQVRLFHQCTYLRKCGRKHSGLRVATRALPLPRRTFREISFWPGSSASYPRGKPWPSPHHS